MNSRSWSSRVWLWAAVCALLLKSAMPMLATGAARGQSVPVADICSVYGVAQQPISGEEPTRQHAGDHCALTGLGALALLADLPPLHRPDQPVSYLKSATTCRSDRDACASWVAQLQHGPPAIA